QPSPKGRGRKTSTYEVYVIYFLLPLMSLLARRGFRETQDALNVFGDHVSFKIDFIAGFELRKVCHFPGFRNDGNFKIIIRQSGDGETDALYCNTAFEYYLLPDFHPV